LRLAEAVHEAIEGMRTIFAARAQTLDVDIDAPDLWVLGDHTRIVQMVGNLLGNAAKFTANGGAIAVALQRRGLNAEISVRDNGVGVAPELMPDIFDLFVQGHQDVERAQGGLGIGLSLVRQLAALHGGTVTAYSSGRAGDGSEFVITLPTMVTPATDPREAPRPAGTARRLILIVDDNHDAADTLGFLLETCGHRTQLAYDGVAGLAALDSIKPDLVLLDIGLPGLSGLEVARRINARPQPPPLIAISGYGQDKDRAASLAAGFRAHITKPVDVDALFALIDKLCDERED
jgi:CheY-like chemotaxis protein